MNYIKQSFRAVFLPILFCCAVLAAADAAFTGVAALLHGIINGESVMMQEEFSGQLTDYDIQNSWYAVLVSIVGLLIVSPLKIGMYSFCFARLQGENPKFSSLFDFYRSRNSFLGSFAAANISAAAVGVAMAVLNMTIGLFLGFAAKDYGTASAEKLASSAVTIIMSAAAVTVTLFFFFTEYGYARYPENGAVNAVRGSFSAAKGCWLKILGIIVLCGGINYGFSVIMSKVSFLRFLEFVVTAAAIWVGTAFAYKHCPAAAVVERDGMKE